MRIVVRRTTKTHLRSFRSTVALLMIGHPFICWACTFKGAFRTSTEKGWQAITLTSPSLWTGSVSRRARTSRVVAAVAV